MALTTVPVELANLDGAVTVNESSADVDFRIESNGNANMLFVNGGNDQVGIGADPSALFHVTHGGGGFDEVARLTSVANSSGDGAFLGFHGNSTSKFYGFIGGYDIGTNEGGIKIGVGNGETAIADSMTKLTIDNDGNVGVGVSPSARLHAYSTSAETLRLEGNDEYTYLSFRGTVSSSATALGLIGYGNQSGTAADLNIENTQNGAMTFATNDSIRMTLTNAGQFNVSQGLMAVGTTSLTGGTSSGNVTIEFAGNVANCIKTRDTSGHSAANSMVMVSGSTAVGTIVTSTSSTTYNTSSDYRLKENVNYDWDALSTLKQLKPAKFNFKIDPDKTVEGFLAHEVSSLVPAAVNGEKDAMETRKKLVLDSKGEVIEEDVEEDVWIAGKENETYPEDSTWEVSKEYPKHQQIDHSKLVPLMVKAIQELEAKVKALEEA